MRGLKNHSNHRRFEFRGYCIYLYLHYYKLFKFYCSLLSVFLLISQIWYTPKFYGNVIRNLAVNWSGFLLIVQCP